MTNQVLFSTLNFGLHNVNFLPFFSLFHSPEMRLEISKGCIFEFQPKQRLSLAQ